VPADRLREIPRVLAPHHEAALAARGRAASGPRIIASWSRIIASWRYGPTSPFASANITNSARVARAIPELVEAAIRARQRRTAELALERLTLTTQHSGSEWALGIEARSRALLSDGEPAERLYQEAIERLRRTRVRVQLARTHLLYGEWLRRERRRVDARDQLRTALEIFTLMGVEAFAGRAERELLATGERVRIRTAETRHELTTQEAQIARLARDGLSNAGIGERLFISQHTVAYHLRKVFSKLDITSRNQLATVLPESASAGRVGSGSAD
jgi:DNA-binding CsgD family transcriptional regulator